MNLISLTELTKGECGIIRKLDESRLPQQSGLEAGGVEARLLEMGFIEGAKLHVLHLGVFGKSPIAVRINNSSSVIAIRRHEAVIILVEKI